MVTKQQEILNLSESKLYDLVIQHDHGAHLKDANSFKYILGNKDAARVLNLDDPNDIVGFTVKDLDKKFMRKFWGNSYANNIDKLDLQAKNSGQIVQANSDTFLNAHNQVSIHNTVKFPLKGKNNKVTSILTLSYDLTKNIDLFHLWGIYKKMHKTIQSAVKHFFNYLGINSGLFNKILKEKDVIHILDLIKNHSSRY